MQPAPLSWPASGICRPPIDPVTRYLAVSPEIRGILHALLIGEIGRLRRKAREARSRQCRRQLEVRADDLRALAEELAA